MSQPSSVRIRVNGRPLDVRCGTVLAAALAGLPHPIWRSAGRGEPRGPICGMGVCFECRVTVDGQPGQRACLLVVRAGLEVATDGAS